jgi:hypothetical protein
MLIPEPRIQAGPLPNSGEPASQNPGIHPPQSNPYGHSLAECAAMYWQWLLSFPGNASPAFEQGEVIYGTQNQPPHLWILESGNSGTFERSVTIPAGKSVLFSISGAEADTLVFPGLTPQDLLDMVEAPFDELTLFPYAEVDGVPISRVEDYLVTSPLFDITVPDPGLFGEPAGMGQAMAKGWFFLLAPLSAGEHTLRVKLDVLEAPEFNGDTAYHITVK